MINYRWTVQHESGCQEEVRGPDLQTVANAHPNAHAIWKAAGKKRTLAIRYAGTFYHVSCFSRKQKACPADKWPVADAYMVSGAQTLIRGTICPGCNKRVLKDWLEPIKKKEGL